ncbi:MAG TPA: DUF2089 domain-containing protein [Oceanithermus profundus]|uniref:DUF2089 domain-containing protein n=1 Tax=Oceanithermus profundus TaxID=187137 RepID=A0A7C4V4H6_9DEIN|nr:DUF2089 domain-containing protein [Oceanithermus profundus]
MPHECPVCHERLDVTGLACPNCQTRIEGRFSVNEFATLPPEQLEILRLFVKTRGNLKEMERILGVSYPTVRARFETLLRVLGYEAAPDADVPGERARVLEQLEKGEISADEAAELLRALKKR